MSILEGRMHALCLVHKDAELGLVQILHQDKKGVHCSASCPPFIRTEINKREGLKFIPVDPLRYTVLPCKKLSMIYVQVQSTITFLLFNINAVFEPSCR